MDKDDPKNREYGTDSLVKIYKHDTPGQKKMKSFLEWTIQEMSGFPPPATDSTTGFSSHLFSSKFPKPVPTGSVVLDTGSMLSRERRAEASAAKKKEQRPQREDEKKLDRMFSLSSQN